MNAYDRLRWWLICFALWALLELLVALLPFDDLGTLVLL